jgi:hypothetical protein
MAAKAKAAETKAGTGRKRSAETCARISEALTGRKRGPLSADHRAKLSEALKGREFSPQHRTRISEALRGRKHSPAARARMSAAHKGRPLSPQHRAKLSEVRTGRPLSPQHRASISAALKNREVSPEHRAKLSGATKGGRFVHREYVDQVQAFLDQLQAGRPESAASPAPRSHALRLGEPRKPTYIDGVEVKPLTASQHAVVRAVQAAGRRGLTLGGIREETGRGGAPTTLRRLCDRHPKWAEIIRFPGRPHGRIWIDAEVVS